MLGITGSDYDYHQTVAGLNGDYRYSGKSKNLDVQLSRVLHRSGTQKTTFTYDVLARESRNYIDDTEVGVQRRQTAAWRVGLQHRHYIGRATLDLGASYQRGTRWFGAPAPEEYVGDATALSKITQLNAQLDLPFTLGSQNFRYNVQYLRQISNTRSPRRISSPLATAGRYADSTANAPSMPATAGMSATIWPGARRWRTRNSTSARTTVKSAATALIT